MTALVLFGSLALFLILTVPIGISIGLSTLVTILYTGSMPLEYLAQGLITSIDSFPLLAVPFFILAGEIMGKGGLSDRLFKVANTIVGDKTGGIAIAAIITCMFFAAISGSGPATVAAVGGIMIPAMIKQGYDKKFATAVVCAAGSIGVIIPPSIPMVMYGVVGSQSIGKLFISGILPGILVGVALMIWTYIYSRKQGYKGIGKSTFREFLKATWDAKWALLVPIIILGGIYGGIFTPTEAAGVAVVYGFIAGVFLYRELKIRDIPRMLIDSGITTATIMLIVGTATAFGRILTVEQIPSQITEGLLSISDNPIIILLLINILLLIVGCFMDTVAAIIILTPLLLPVAMNIGVDPIHFGLIMVVNLAIGFITPPLGVNLFVGSGVSGISIEALAKAVMPFFIAMVISLLILTYIPQVSLFLVEFME
ncbi:TRAP transporter large permease [Robertmurraya sp. P23]|uniref:TRAP transporter large permease n=1 Tax=Robertmurraya sp. P23 TaxID=3436931 RepID=UPI003D967796